MSWAKVDDRANEHRKMLEAGAEACWLWTCGLMYANRQPARDGFIPELALGMLYPFKSPKRLAERLVSVGLWVREIGGYRIHDYHQWNPTAADIEADRAAGRERAAKSYAARRGKRTDSSAEETGEESSEESTKEQNSSGPLHSTPTPEKKDPPTPKPKPADPMGDSLRGKSAHQRADVLRVHARWQTIFGLNGHRFRGYGDLDAQAVAEAIDSSSLETCLRVLEFAPKDGMVSGRDDERRVKHDSLRYIFGNAQAFARILRAADEEQSTNRESTVSKIARMKQQEPGAA